MSDPSGTGMVVFFGTLVLGLVCILIVISGLIAWGVGGLAAYLGHPFEWRILWGALFVFLGVWWRRARR